MAGLLGLNGGGAAAAVPPTFLTKPLKYTIYTVGHKKRATQFGIITPMFHGGFYTSCTNGNRKKYCIGELQILQL